MASWVHDLFSEYDLLVIIAIALICGLVPLLRGLDRTARHEQRADDKFHEIGAKLADIEAQIALLRRQLLPPAEPPRPVPNVPRGKGLRPTREYREAEEAIERDHPHI